MRLSPDLLMADFAGAASGNSTFRATIAAHGLYNTQQFVLRLSPVVHQKLASGPQGITSNTAIGFERGQAMSTFLHETVHWWQHIGSTYGFLLSLNYPVQSHATHLDLKRLVEEDGFKKSVFLQASELNCRGPAGIGTPAGIANSIINNHFDLLAFRAFTLGPDAAKDVVEEDLFESVGHAFEMTYANTLFALASSVDLDFRALPDPREWVEGFRKLADEKAEGYFYGSPVGLWPIGSFEIFEGQARFAQIQFLSHACGHRLDWDTYRGLGMLSGVYVKAFEEFLRLTDTKWPSGVNDPLVGLFLLVCDLAINPGRGFPFTVDPNYETFILDVNPGARFCIFCRLIAREYPAMTRAINRYDRAEYEEVTTQLSLAAKEYPPLLIAKTFAEWFTSSGQLAGLRREYDDYAFLPVNYVIRHLFAHFLVFQNDKYLSPEFFCWPGAWMAGERVSEKEMRLFERHGALFVDKEEDDSVFPRLQANRNEAAIHRVFNEFYLNAVVYDLTNQWIAADGPFKYDMHWLSASASPEDMAAYMSRAFKAAFGLETGDVELLA
jgi:hypothetical protein